MSALKHLGLGTWISIGDPVVTEIVSQLGFEWLLMDMEHGSLEPASLPDNLRACVEGKYSRLSGLESLPRI